MKTALFAYWGAVGDHNLNIPGHPLYQLYFLRVLKKKFGFDKVFFYSFLKKKVEKSAEDAKFFIQQEERQRILEDLKLEIVSLQEALEMASKADFIFLKARFRNRSRISEGSYDALKFEKLLEAADPSRTWIVDSDGELPKDFFREPRKIVTYFQKASDFYRDTYGVQPEVISLPCALSEDFCFAEKTLETATYDLFFIGNQGLKQKSLPGLLEELSRSGLSVAVQGKWKPSFSFKIYKRTERDLAYRLFERSLSTLQWSKAKYREYSFLSPRIYEAAVCGLVPFIERGYLCSTPFTSVDGFISLRERLQCLRDGFDRDFNAIREESYEKLAEIEQMLV